MEMEMSNGNSRGAGGGKGKRKARRKAVNHPTPVAHNNEEGPESASSAGVNGVMMTATAGQVGSSWNPEQQRHPQFYPYPGHVTAAPPPATAGSEVSSWNPEQQRHPQFYPYPGYVTTVAPPAPPPTTNSQLAAPDPPLVMYPGQQMVQVVGEGGGTYMVPLNYSPYPFGYPQQQGGQQIHAACGNPNDSRSPSFIYLGPPPPPQPSHPEQPYYERRRGMPYDGSARGRGRGGHWKSRVQRREHAVQQYILHCQQQQAQMPVPNFYPGYGYPEDIQYQINPMHQHQQLGETETEAPEPGSPLVVQTAHGSMHVYRSPSGPSPTVTPPTGTVSPEMEHHDHEQNVEVEMPGNVDNTSDGFAPPVQQQDDGRIYYIGKGPDGHDLHVESSYQSITVSVVVPNTTIDPEALVAATNLNDVVHCDEMVENCQIAEINVGQNQSSSSESTVVAVGKEAEFSLENLSINHTQSESVDPFPASSNDSSCSQEPEIICNIVETLGRKTQELVNGTTPIKITEKVDKRLTGQWYATSSKRPASLNHRGMTDSDNGNVDNHVHHNNITDIKQEKGTTEDKFRAKPAVETRNASTASASNANKEGKGRASGYTTWKPFPPGAATASRFYKAPVVGLNATNAGNRPRYGRTFSNRKSAASSSDSKKVVPDKITKPAIDDFPQLRSSGTKPNTSSKQIYVPATVPSTSSKSSNPGRSWARIASGQSQLAANNNVGTRQTSESDSGSDSVHMIDKGSGDSAVPGLAIWRGGR